MGTRKSQPVEQRMPSITERTRAAERAAHEAEVGTRPGDLMQLALGFAAPPARAALAARPAHLPPSACPTAASAGGSRSPRRARGAEEASAATPARAARSGPLSKHATTATVPAARPALGRAPAGRVPSAVAPVAPVAPRDARERPGLGATSASMQRHFGELREALDEGWEIVQPIFARPLWSAPDDSATAFNFVLRSPRGTRLITVPQGRPVERFIRDRHLTVDYAR